MQPAQVTFFEQQGYLRLQGFYPRTRMSSNRKRVLDELERLRLWDAGKRMSNPLQGLPPFQQIARLSSRVKVPGLHEELVSHELLAMLTPLGGRVPSAVQATQLLLSPPDQGAWTMQRLNWHVDSTANHPDGLPGVQLFVLIDDVAPRGGATLALAGSHRVRSRPSSRLREVLRTSANLKAGLEQLGITVVEMSGSAGDTFLMDMRVLHTPSINSTRNLRMMATTRFFFGS